MKRDRNPTSAMQIGTIVAGIVFFILGAAISIYSRLNLKNMGGQGLGAGFLPFCYGLVLSALSVAVIIRAARGSYENSKGRFPVRDDLLVMAVLSLIVVGTIIFMRVLGMTISIAIYLLLTMKLVEKQSWKLSVLTSIIGTACIYLVFCVCFKINFPAGFLGF